MLKRETSLYSAPSLGRKQQVRLVSVRQKALKARRDGGLTHGIEKTRSDPQIKQQHGSKRPGASVS